MRWIDPKKDRERDLFNTTLTRVMENAGGITREVRALNGDLRKRLEGIKLK